MGQTLGVDGNMAFDPGDLLPRVITFLTRCVRVLYALCIHDQVRGTGVAPLFLSDRSNLIFLRPAPAGSLPCRRVRSSLNVIRS